MEQMSGGYAELGVLWWNGLTEDERRLWLLRADSATPAHAWEAYNAWLDFVDMERGAEHE